MGLYALSVWKHYICLNANCQTTIKAYIGSAVSKGWAGGV